MPGRKYSVANTNYRYGFNGKENDNEVKGEGNQQDYGMRIYDPRLGRFLSVDPLLEKFPFYAPYLFAGNKPLWSVDLDGLEELPKTNVDFQEISAKSLKRIITEEQVKTQLAENIYSQINRNVPSKQELHYYSGRRYGNEKEVIINAIKENIVVDINNASAAILNPDTKEPDVFYRVSKWAINHGINEAAPFVTQASGVTMYNVGTIFEKVTEQVEKHKSVFYKKFFNAKYMKASGINSKALSATGKFFKFGGALLKGAGKVLNVVGTAQIWYSVLNTSPGPLSDEEIRKATLTELKKFVEKNNSSNSSASTNSQNNEQN